jgi:hypothetical protein
MSTQPENVPAQLRSSHLRLLPWTENDKPAYLSTHNTETYLSRLADTVENQQTEAAAVILGLARPMVEDTTDLTTDELRWIARRLCESLTDALRVCESRAGRIPPYEGDTAAQDDSDADTE